jgi:histidine triad (HIT) family protein
MVQIKEDQCIFCKIVAKEIPAKIVAEDEQLMAFSDIQPAADIHLLIIPKVHLTSLNELSAQNKHLMADMAVMAQRLACELGVDSSGYRLVINSGKDAGQTVFHLHLHLMAGRKFSWPPG